MIYAELTQNTTTVYLSVDGIERNSKWYDAGISDDDTTALSYSLDTGYVKVNDCRIAIYKNFLSDFDLIDRVFDIKIYYKNNNKKLFEGKAIIIDDTESIVVFQLRTEEYENMLLDDAPDLGDLTNRVYPRVFGIGKFVEPLLLDDVNLIYHAAYGTVQAVYDDGVSVGFTDNGDGTFTLSANPVGSITMDVNAVGSTIIEVAQFVANRLGLTFDGSLATAEPVNYFVNQQVNALQFLSEVCKYCNHFFYIDNTSSTKTLKLVQKYLDFSSVPNELIISKDGFGILKEGTEKNYNQIIKQFQAKWTKRASVQNPQRVQETEASIVVNTGTNAGKIEDVPIYDYFETNIQNALENMRDLNNLHQVELKIADIVCNMSDIGKIIQINNEEVVDISKNNWVQIVKPELDFLNAKTIIKGHGQINWRQV